MKSHNTQNPRGNSENKVPISRAAHLRSLVDGKTMSSVLSTDYYRLMFYASHGVLPSFKVGRVRRFDVDEVLDFIRSGKMAEKLEQLPERPKKKKKTEAK